MSILPSCFFHDLFRIDCLRALDEEFIAIFTALDGVVLRETLPVLLLFWRQETRPVAERTDIVKGRHDRRPDELRAIGYIFDNLQQIVIDLEGDNSFLLFHVMPSDDFTNILLSNTFLVNVFERVSLLRELHDTIFLNSIDTIRASFSRK
jgi:hypothetical protein